MGKFQTSFHWFSPHASHFPAAFPFSVRSKRDFNVLTRAEGVTSLVLELAFVKEGSENISVVSQKMGGSPF